MSKLPSRYELGLASLAGVAGVAGSYAVAGYTRSFVVAPIDSLVVQLTPGSIVTYFIENVGEEAHLLHIALSFAIAATLFGAVSLAGITVANRIDNWTVAGGIAGVLTWAVAVVITSELLLAVGAAIPVAVATALGQFGLSRTPEPHEPSRRRVLGAVATTLGFAGVSAGAGTVLSQSEPLSEVEGAEGVEARFQEAEQNQLSVASDSLPGLVSDIDNFYNVDIAEFNPEVTKDEWSVTLTGEVANEDLTIDYEDLKEMPTEHRHVTLRCVGENLNGKKLDNAVWTGTPIAPLLDEVDPDGECGCVVLRAEDGYFVEYPVEVLRNGFLAWGMNGKELPQAHGHPVRILIPGHWGETNVKWLTEIEMLDEKMDGYWEQRGWQGTGTVKTIAKLWDEGISDLDDGRTELAGHAYAGTRGIERVEVSTDGGDTWNEATLSEPLEDEDVWRQWRYRFEPSGTHDVVVRAVDGEGNLQIEEDSSPSPTGSSGWVRKTVRA